MKTITRIAIAAAAFFFAGAAFAQAYVFANVTSAKVTTTTTPDTSGTDRDAAHVGGGYRFNKYVAAEVSYLSVNREGQAGTTVAGWEATGPGAAVIGSLPIGEAFSVLGKFGFYQLDSEVRVRTGTLGVGTVTKSDHGLRPTFGIGAQFNFSRQVSGRIMLEQLKGDEFTELDKLRLLGVGVVVSF